MRFRLTALIFGMICISSFLCSCSLNNESQGISIDSDEEIILSVDEDSISAEGLTLNIQNVSERTIYLDPWYCIERRLDGDWESVEPAQGARWDQDDWRMSIYADTQESNDYFWEWYYGKLPSGEYRIIVLVLTDDENETSTAYNLAAEFLFHNT